MKQILISLYINEEMTLSNFPQAPQLARGRAGPARSKGPAAFSFYHGHSASQVLGAHRQIRRLLLYSRQW